MGPDHPTFQRHMSYAKRMEWFGMFTYSPPGHRPIIDRELGMAVFPSNSVCKAAFLFDVLMQGRKIVKEHRVDLLVAQDPFGFGLAAYMLHLMCRIPLVVHVHAHMLGNPYWLNERWTHRLLHLLGRFVAGRADVIRPVSSKIRESLIHMGYPPSKVFYVSPPVNRGYAESEGSIDKRELTATYGLSKDRVFVSVGRLSYQKNLDMLLQATAMLKGTYPDLKVLVIGEGPERARLTRMSDRLGIKNHLLFLGSVPNRDLAAYFEASLALVLTSVYEGTAKVIKEAAFAGRPTISTNTSGVSDAMIHGETGMVVPIGDVNALVKTMDQLLKNPEESLVMGRKANDFVSRSFDYERGVDALVSVWRTAAMKGRRT